MPSEIREVNRVRSPSGEFIVSTLYFELHGMPLDHRHIGDIRQYETMIFKYRPDGKLDPSWPSRAAVSRGVPVSGYQWKYTQEQEALQGHRHAVVLLRRFVRKEIIH